MKSVKILYISPQNGGGAIESLLQLIMNLDPDEYSSVVLFERPTDDALRARFFAAGATVIDAPQIVLKPARAQGQGKDRSLRKRIKRHIHRGIVRAYRELHSVWQTGTRDVPRAIRMSRIIRQVSADVVHVNSAPHDGLAGIIAARIAGVPCVCHVRTMLNLSIIQRVLARTVHKFIFISTAVQRHQISRKVGVSKGIVIHNGVDVSAFRRSSSSTLREELDVADDQLLVGMIGRLEYWKGQNVFIESIRRLIGQGENVRAVIIGGAQEGRLNRLYYESLLGLVRDYELQDVIHFLGHRDDIPELMSQLDALVLASTQPEPFGRVIIEAMAAGTLVIATAAGGVLDIIRDRENGLLFHVGDAKRLAQAISWAGSHQAEVSEILARAGADVSRRFASDCYAANVMDVYEEILDRGTVPKRTQRGVNR